MTVEITCVLSPIGGKFPGGYADSLAVTDSRVYFRECYGFSWSGHGTVVARMRPDGGMNLVDIEGMPGYRRVGDGQQIISNIGASADGARVVLGYKQDTHGALILQNRWSGKHYGPDGQVVGEYGPPRTLGGVTVAKVGDSYFAYSLTTSALWVANITSSNPGKLRAQVVQGAIGGVERSLVGTADGCAYVGPYGDVVNVKGTQASVEMGAKASCVATEGADMLIGVAGGMWHGPMLWALPGTPQAVTLLKGVPYAWVTIGGIQRLFREKDEILALPADEWPVVVSRGFGSQLYVGTTRHFLVVRVA